jgi:hypothetical protein
MDTSPPTGGAIFLIALIGIGGWLIVDVGIEIFDIALLAYGGKDTAAYVYSYDPKTCGGRKVRRTCHYHGLYADGHKFRLDLEQPVQIGALVEISYLPRDPSIVRSGFVGDSPWLYIRSQIGWMEGIMFILGIVGVGAGAKWWFDANARFKAQQLERCVGEGASQD